MSWPKLRGDDSLQAGYRDGRLIEAPHSHLPTHPSTINLSSFPTNPKQSDLFLDFASATAYLPSKPSPNYWPDNSIDPALVDPQHPSLAWGYPTEGNATSEFGYLTTNAAPMSLGHRRSASNQSTSLSTGSPSEPSTRDCSNGPFQGSRPVQHSQAECGNDLRCQWPECAEGAKKFSSKHCLRRHVETIHERPGAYACDICGRRFNRADNLREHERKSHPGMN
ncbi:hypothetical protein ASPVEDRAFT_30499 [Aspergillus versicolor CBS 583.65]|uniref:C2H2-type domain-containing protein n=1 Tax=Aspergillus versicolor CBS 583.65 TaxID=1036611 RepID=A0A1L9PR68_ASPVE|nr:uncharacterized protein ASPVEDRAFT_30499 [Aspergillus versicolor CBS 583.65]OJJ04019.1 hypothetical protein ASPVEDRAFT_30499 [Aspergillus versicolor CBS 583.65]